MSRATLMFLALVLLMALMAPSCDSCPGQPSPGVIVVVGPSDGNASTVEWETSVGDAYTRSTSPSGGKLREDFVGTGVLELTCDGNAMDEIVLTFGEVAGALPLKIKKTSLGLQWCFDLGGGSESCLMASATYNDGEIPADFHDPTHMWGDRDSDGTCSEVRFQVEL